MRMGFSVHTGENDIILDPYAVGDLKMVQDFEAEMRGRTEI